MQNKDSEKVLTLIQDLFDVMHRLRKECPWDQEQNLSTLRPFLLEESYECVAAMNAFLENPNDTTRNDLLEELGDVFLQILFQTEILQENSSTNIRWQVFSLLKEKLVRRHPHVFGTERSSATNSEEVLVQWEKIKKSEKGDSRSLGLADDLAKKGKGLSSLKRASKLGAASKKVAFDWANAHEVWKHFETELKEIAEARTPEEKEHELGDLLFCLAQWARHEGVDPEVALHGANERFVTRFRTMLEISTKNFESLTSDEKEELWQRAKAHLKSTGKT